MEVTFLSKRETKENFLQNVNGNNDDVDAIDRWELLQLVNLQKK